MSAKLFIGDIGALLSITLVSDYTWRSNLAAESVCFGPFSKKW